VDFTALGGYRFVAVTVEGEVVTAGCTPGCPQDQWERLVQSGQDFESLLAEEQQLGEALEAFLAVEPGMGILDTVRSSIREGMEDVWPSVAAESLAASQDKVGEVAELMRADGLYGITGSLSLTRALAAIDAAQLFLPARRASVLATILPDADIPAIAADINNRAIERGCHPLVTATPDGAWALTF